MLLRSAAILFLIAVLVLAPQLAQSQAFEEYGSNAWRSSILLDATDGPDDHTPRGALLRSLAIPGWGQWYNRQYYKIPIVYAGLAGLTVATFTFNDAYLIRRRALLYDFDSEEYAHFQPEFERFSVYFDQGRDDLVRQQRDAMRRNRDLFILLTGAWWALATIEAYVSAHLLDFDVDEDLSFSVQPGPQGMTAQLKLRL